MTRRPKRTHGRLAGQVRVLEAVHDEEPERTEREQRALKRVDIGTLTRTCLGLQLLHCPLQQLGVDLPQRREQDLGETHHVGPALGHPVGGERFGGRLEETQRPVDKDPTLLRVGMSESRLDRGQQS